jgi:hypothetical protein
MKSRFAKRAAAYIVAVSLLAEAFVVPTSIVGAAATAPGTNITNSATATYTDASGNTYSTTSNTVTTVVQNAPTLSETAAAGSQYSPGQVISDVFTITNQGNAAGNIQVSGNNTVDGSGAFSSVSDATLGGADSSFGTIGSGPTVSGCSDSGTAAYSVTIGATTTSCASITDLNTFLNTQSVAAGANVTVTVYYALANNATTSGSPAITSTLYSNIAYAAVGGAVAEISAVATATETNTVVADANVNQYKAQAQCATSPCTPSTDNVGDVIYTVSATNGGAKAAKDLVSVKSLVGATVWNASIDGGADAGGVMLSDKVPQFGSPVAPLALSNASGGNYQITVAVNSAYGFATGAKAYLVYSTSSTAATWTAAGGSAVTTGSGTFTIPTGTTVYYLAVVIVHGTCTTSGFELCSYTANTTTNGASNVATYPAVQYSYTVAQPTGPGSANTGSITNVGDAIWGDNQTTEHVLGPSIPSNTSDTTCAGTCLNVANEGINYISSSVIPGGSNQTAIQALAAYATLTGPYDSSETGACSGVSNTTNCLGADATGSYDGSVSSTNGNDFTAAGFDSSADNIVNTGTVAGTPATSTTTGAGSTLCIEHTLFNSGNKNDSYGIAVGAQPTGYALPTTSGGTVSSGWTFGIYSDSGCSSALGGSTQGATTAATNVAVSSGANLQYYVKYVVPSGLKYFTRFDATITATSNGTGSPANTTHDELYSSFIALTKSVNVTSTNCPSGALPSLPSSSPTGAEVCPGGTLQYTVDYRNLVLGTASTNVSFAQTFTQAGLLNIDDDGTGTGGGTLALGGAFTNGNYTSGNWGVYTNGLTGAPTDNDSASAARSGGNASTLTYWLAGSSTGTAAAATRFNDKVGGSTFQLIPHGFFTSSIAGNPSSVTEPAAKDWQGTITFTAIVK